MLFENEPYFKLIQLVAGIHIKTRKFTEKQIKKLNMTYPQLGALMALVRKDDITQRELAELLETDATTVMVLCDSLEKRGWLIRSRDKTDRRVNRLILTDSGRDIYAQAMKLIQTGYEYVFNKTQSDELNRVLPFLEEVYQHIKEVTQDHGTASERPRLYVAYVPAKSNLGVTKIVDNSTPDEGEIITYTDTLANAGPYEATNVFLTDTLPVSLTLVYSGSTQGTYDSGSGLWTVGSLSNGASAILTLTAQVDAATAGMTIANTASASADQDPDTGRPERQERAGATPAGQGDETKPTKAAPGPEAATARTRAAERRAKADRPRPH